MSNKKIDPIECNVPNVCFSLCSNLNTTDDRKIVYKNQRLNRGFDDTETWNLDATIALFIYPRLKRFLEIGTNGHPGNLTDKSWRNILRKILKAFEYKYKIALNEIDDDIYQLHSKEITEGLKLFGEYYNALWC